MAYKVTKCSVETQTQESALEKRHQWKKKFIKCFLEDASEELNDKKVQPKLLLPYRDRMLKNISTFKRVNEKFKIFEDKNPRLFAGCETLARSIYGRKQYYIPFHKNQSVSRYNEWIIFTKKKLEEKLLQQQATPTAPMKIVKTEKDVNDIGKSTFSRCPYCKQDLNNSKHIKTIEQQKNKMHLELKKLQKKLQKEQKKKKLVQNETKMCLPYSDSKGHISSFCDESSRLWEISNNNMDCTNWDNIIFKKRPSFQCSNSKTLLPENVVNSSSSDIQELPCAASSSTMIPSNFEYSCSKYSTKDVVPLNKSNENPKMYSPLTLEEISNSFTSDMKSQKQDRDDTSSNNPFRKLTLCDKPFQ